MHTLTKCLVWDLDDTLWSGICLEGHVTRRQEAVGTVKELDRRGILQSIASRGDEHVARHCLREMGLEEFFLVPQINWLPKSRSVLHISKELDIPLDAMAFIDDDAFERAQIGYMLPDVFVLPASDAGTIPSLPSFIPSTSTAEAGARRKMYATELSRKEAERSFASRGAFLESCNMRLRFRPARLPDLPRIMELMTRTHQLNTSGRGCTPSEAEDIINGHRPGLSFSIFELSDRFGDYGVIGVALLETRSSRGRLLYLALSCRVMGRGIERAFIAHLGRTARTQGIRHLDAEFRDTGRNHMMRAMYQMMHFRPGTLADESGMVLFTAPTDRIPDVPSWIHIV